MSKADNESNELTVGAQDQSQVHEGKRISEQAAKEAGLERMTDMAQFGNLVVAWHIDRVNQGQHVLNMDISNPEDPMKGQVWVREPGHPDTDEDGLRPLSDQEVIIFKHGVRYMLDLFEQLPFAYTPTDADGKVLGEYASEDTIAELEQEDGQTPS